MPKLQLFILSLFTLLIGKSAFSQEEIKVYQAKPDFYLVGTRVYSAFLVTNAGVIVIDPIDSAIAKATMVAIKKVTKQPVKYVFYSHNHWDHISDGKIFKDAGAKFIAHEKAAETIATNKRIIKPDSTWNGDQTIFKLGDKTLELFYYGKNHGDGMTVFRLPQHKALFIVDLVVPDRVLYAYLPDAKPKDWLADLYEIRKLDFQDLYMSHVRPIGNRKDLDLTIQYFEDLYAATDKAIKDGTPFFDIPKTVKMPQYKNLQNYDDWLHMNVWRILMEKSIGQ